MRILGVDPGTAVTGFAILEGREFRVCDYGTIRPKSTLPLADRYTLLFESLEALVAKWEPEAVVFETQFLPQRSPNVQGILKLGGVRSLVAVAARRKGAEVIEYSPARWKRAVTGNGRASKEQTQRTLQQLLKLTVLPTPFDAADALGLAFCHAHSLKSQLILGGLR